NDSLTSGETLSCEPTVSSLNDEIDFKISFDDFGDEDYTRPRAIRHMDLPPCDQRNQYLRYEGLQYTDVNIVDFETRFARIYRREVHRVQIVFTSRVWRRIFDIRGPLVHELILEFFSTFKFGEAMTDLDTAGALQFRRLSWRLCHRLIACNIFGRSQAPEKVTVTDLFYLRGMDVGSINVPYSLARYLRLFAARRKSGALISGGQFIARLAKYFGLLTEERLRGLTVIAPALPVIDMTELVRLHIYMEIDDTWAWVAMGPERQPDAADGAPGVVQDAPIINEGDQAVLTPVQAPPPTAARTMP
ncbi:hypothetical protein Tco_1464599, partial [Tanacetum coccineum]